MFFTAIARKKNRYSKFNTSESMSCRGHKFMKNDNHTEGKEEECIKDTNNYIQLLG